MVSTCRTLSTVATVATAAALAVVVALTGAPAAAVRCALPRAYAGKSGVVSIEAEWQAPSRSSKWSRTNRLIDGRRTTFVVYKAGNKAHWVEPPPRKNANDILSFPFRVDKSGYYRVLLRSAAPHTTEWNDAWVSLPDPFRQTYGFIRRRWGNNKAWRPLNAAATRGWTKAYQNKGTTARATFDTFTVDHNPSVLVTRWLRRGQTYTLRVAGRSTRWALDRIVLFQCTRSGSDECVLEDKATFQAAIRAPRSRCGGV